MPAIKDFLVKIGFDYDKSGQKQTESGIKAIQSGFNQMGTALNQAETFAKKSLHGVSTAVANVDNSLEKAQQQTEKFQDAVQKTKVETVSDVKDIEESFGSLGDAISRASVVLATLASGVALQKLYGYVTTVAERFEQISFTAKEIGTDDVEGLASMQYAFRQMGVDVDTLNDGLRSLTDIIGQAKLGEGEGLEVFKALKINFKDEKGNARSTIDLFDDLIDKLGQVDHATKVAYINMLGLDTETIKGIITNREELEKFRTQYVETYAKAGISINETAKKAEKFNQSMRALTQTITAIRDGIGAKFLDIGTKTFDRLRVIAQDNMGKVVEVMSKVIDVIYSVFMAIVNLGSGFVDLIKNVIDWWKNTDEGFKTVAKTVGLVTAAILALTLAFKASPLGKFIMLLTTVALLFEDFEKWKNNDGRTFLGEKFGSYSDVLAKIQDFGTKLGPLNKVLVFVFENIDKILIALVGIPFVLKRIGGAFKLLKGGISFISKGIGLIKSVGTALGGVISKAFSLRGIFINILTMPIKAVFSRFGAIIIALGGAFYLAYQHCEEFRNAVKPIIDWIVPKISDLVNFLQTQLNAFFDWFSDKIDAAIGAVKSFFSALTSGGGLLDFSDNKFFNGIKDGANKAIDYVKGLWGGDDVSTEAPTTKPLATSESLSVLNSSVSGVVESLLGLDNAINTAVATQSNLNQIQQKQVQNNITNDSHNQTQIVVKDVNEAAVIATAMNASPTYNVRNNAYRVS